MMEDVLEQNRATQRSKGDSKSFSKADLKEGRGGFEVEPSKHLGGMSCMNKLESCVEENRVEESNRRIGLKGSSWSSLSNIS